ncbi:MAG TPA: sigma-70 family RNA polymerase sigma factor [Thermoguttaceae bacterium]|nr:sigma-70 family RNA polymerase sigma factor [Thermoguttaceae bacterium]
MRLESPPDQEQLLRSARAGKLECLGQLLQLYGNYLKLLAATQIDEKLLARSSPSDVVQETFLEAHRDFGQFRGQSVPEFLAWLRRILVNNLSRLVEKHVLAEKRDVRRETSLGGIGGALERSAARLESVLVDQAASPSSNAQRREYAIILANQLAELSQDYRDVLVLRHLEGLPFGEVAERMGRSPGAVRMLWLRAIGQLRERLDARGLT